MKNIVDKAVELVHYFFNFITCLGFSAVKEKNNPYGIRCLSNVTLSIIVVKSHVQNHATD